MKKREGDCGQLKLTFERSSGIACSVASNVVNISTARTQKAPSGSSNSAASSNALEKILSHAMSLKREI